MPDPSPLPVAVTLDDDLIALRRRATRAGVWSVANMLFVRFVSVGTTAVLARLIDPAQFGVFAVALIVFSVVISISEMGVSVALVRTTGSIRKIAPTVVTLSLASSVVLCIVCLLAAPYFAAAMHAPEATNLLRVIALGLPLAGLSSVPGAITQREFRQDRKAIAEGSATVVILVVSVPLALMGFGAWSLAWSRLAGLLTTAIVLIALTNERYRPGFDMAEARHLLRFGLPLAGSSLLVLAVMNVDNVIVGRMLGLEALGFYSLAFSISSWPIAVFSAPARNVSVVWLTQLREGGHDTSRGLADLLRPLMTAAIPACVLLAVVAEPLVAVVYGRTWVPAAAALSVLAALGAFRVLLEVGYDTLVSAGRSNAILVIHVIWFGTLVPVLIGLGRFGLVGIAWGQVLVIIGIVTPLYLVYVRSLGMSLTLAGRPLVRPLLGGALMAAIGWAVNRTLDGDLLRLVACTLLGVIAYAVVAVPDVVARTRGLLHVITRAGRPVSTERV